MTEIFHTATEDFEELESIRSMASTYDIPDDLLVSTWTKIKSDPEHEIRTYHVCRYPSEARAEMHCRIDIDPDIDDMHNSRPDAYKIGWSSACDKIAVVDAIFDALPFDATEEDFPANFAELREYASNEVERLRHERRLTFLARRTWTNENRCAYWTWQGREDCAEYACRYLNKVDNDIPSDDLAKILRKNNSISKMLAHIRDRLAITEADHRLCVIGGA